MSVVAALMVWAWFGAHATWECPPRDLGLLYQCDTARTGFVPGQDRTQGTGILAPFLVIKEDPNRDQRMADERRVDELLKGGM